MLSQKNSHWTVMIQEKIFYSSGKYKWDTDCRNAQSAFSLWVDCCRLAIAFTNASFALCVQYSREWPSNKRSNLFVTEFNARVNWVRPTTRVGDKSGNQSLPRNFYVSFYIFIKMLCWSMFHVKPLNKVPTTCILNWGPLFLHGSIYSRL